MDSGVAASIILLSGCMIAIYIFIAWLQSNKLLKGRSRNLSFGTPDIESQDKVEQLRLSPFKCRFCGFFAENMYEGEPFCPRCDKSQI